MCNDNQQLVILQKSTPANVTLKSIERLFSRLACLKTKIGRRTELVEEGIIGVHVAIIVLYVVNNDVESTRLHKSVPR